MDSSVHFVSLGCPKNLVDSQVMLGLLDRERYTISDDAESADVIIVNTCSFIQAAKEESINTILEMAEHKETGRCQVLVVSGCLPQRYSQELQEEIPEIDLLIGTGQYHRITELLEKKDALPQRAYIDQPAFIHTETDPRMQTGPQFSAFLKLSEGCNRRCAFCIIPKLRGNVRSRTVDSLVQESTQLAARGVRELNLVAQDLTEYGMEWKYRESLETLLPQLCRVEGIEWIRLHYVYPDAFSDRLIDIVASEPKIVPYLDMPVQHTNDRVLKLMNRRLTKAHLFGLVEKLRARIPNLVFRTSIIVGFPTETEAEFEELSEDLRHLDFEHVGVFSYSEEEGTPAAEMSPQVDEVIRLERKNRLIGQLEELSFERNQEFLGKTVEVLFEGASEETDLLYQGRMSTQAQGIDGHVLINDFDVSSEKLQPGQFVQVRITEALPHDLVGKAISCHS